MDRRSFLQKSSFAALSAAAIEALPTPKADAQWPGVNPNLITSSTVAHQIATANGSRGIHSPVDWANTVGITQSMASNLVTWNPVFQGFLAKISPSQLSASLIPREKIVAGVRHFNPAFTDAQCVAALNKVPMYPFQLQQGYAALRAYGLQTTVGVQAQHNSLVASYFRVIGSSSVSAAEAGAVTEAEALVAQQKQPVGYYTTHPQAPPHPESGSGGQGGYNCADDAAAGLVVGTVLGVLAVMASPALAGVLAGGAILSAVLDWGTVGVGLWGLGHAMVCNF